MSATNLPEGTDSIIDDAVDAPEDPAGFDASGELDVEEPETGSSSGGDTRADRAQPSAADAKAALGDAKAKIGETAAGLKGQATDKAREYALLGKDRATETLHNVAKLIDDAAATVDDKIGAQYGDYVRQASGYAKTFAASIEDKDVDELFAQGRELVKQSPAIALGAAAAIGFALTRIVKAGLEQTSVEPAANDVAFTPDPDLTGRKG